MKYYYRFTILKLATDGYSTIIQKTVLHFDKISIVWVIQTLSDKNEQKLKFWFADNSK